MPRLVLAARAAEQLVGAVRDDLVAIHVVGRAGAGLVGINDEVLAMSARQYFISGADDRISELFLEPARLAMCQRGRFLDPTARVDKCGQRPQLRNREVVAGALGLNTPEC